MDYHLAERLRDPGFPQSGAGRHIGAPIAVVWRARDLVYAPALEELIAACGDQFGEMARRPDGSFEATACGGSLKQTGNSPTDAVARLWLTINGVREG